MEPFTSFHIPRRFSMPPSLFANNDKLLLAYIMNRYSKPFTEQEHLLDLPDSHLSLQWFVQTDQNILKFQAVLVVCSYSHLNETLFRVSFMSGSAVVAKFGIKRPMKFTRQSQVDVLSE